MLADEVHEGQAVVGIMGGPTILPQREPAEPPLVVLGELAVGFRTLLFRESECVALADHLAADRPYLGICLGLQVLFEGSEEAPGRAGLGILPGEVARLRGGTDAAGERVKIPHMGWNTARVQGEGARYIPDGGWFYFVHSFAVRPRDPAVIAAVTDHGEDFCSAVARGRMLGVQFHPEKSQREGLALIARWARETGVTT
jgi:glutamine amidotransferase